MFSRYPSSASCVVTATGCSNSVLSPRSSMKGRYSRRPDKNRPGKCLSMTVVLCNHPHATYKELQMIVLQAAGMTDSAQTLRSTMESIFHAVVLCRWSGMFQGLFHRGAKLVRAQGSCRRVQTKMDQYCDTRHCFPVNSTMRVGYRWCGVISERIPNGRPTATHLGAPFPLVETVGVSNYI